MHERMERLEREMRETIAEVHRHYRRDLVPYEPPRPMPTRSR
jgi:hypothetical protein